MTLPRNGPLSRDYVQFEAAGEQIPWVSSASRDEIKPDR